MRLLKYILIFIIAAAAFSGCGRNARPTKRFPADHGHLLRHQNQKLPRCRRPRRGNRKTLTEVNAEMSVFDPDSELSKINAAPAGQWLELSEPMRKVMKKAHEIYRLSGGAFDPTVGRLIDLWGFGVKKERNVPTTKKYGHCWPPPALTKSALTKTGKN